MDLVHREDRTVDEGPRNLEEGVVYHSTVSTHSYRSREGLYRGCPGTAEAEGC